MTRVAEDMLSGIRAALTPQLTPAEGRRGMTQVMVDGDLLRQIIRALMGYGSTLHAQASAASNPGVQAGKQGEIEAVQKLESALRDALTQPTPEQEQVRHRKSGQFYTLVGPGKHKQDGKWWVEVVLYRNADGEVFSREAANFEQSFERLAQAGAEGAE